MPDYSKLNASIAAGRTLLEGNSDPVRSHDNFGEWVDTITKLLGQYSPSTGLATEWLALGSSSLVTNGGYYNDPTSWAQFSSVVQQRIRWLGQVPQRITVLEKLNSAPAGSVPAAQVRPIANNTQDIFVVHGRDEEVKATVARYLEKLELHPIILHEQPNRGRTIIEKFEAYADVSFAIVLLTPDDEGGLKGGTMRPRARQNVILELGYFIGRLGRGHVAALYKGEGIDIPSDYQGVLFTPFDAGGGWKMDLVRELKAAGFSIDANQAF